MNKPETIMIDDQKYVRADSINDTAKNVDGLTCVLVRSYGAGVFMGYLKEKSHDANGVNVVLIKSRRIHYWSGACSLSQIAVEGSKDIKNCRIAMIVPEMFIANCIEIIPVSKKSMINIMEADEWKK